MHSNAITAEVDLVFWKVSGIWSEVDKSGI